MSYTATRDGCWPTCRRAADVVVLGRHGANGRLTPGPAYVIHAVVGHAHGTVVTVPPHSA